MFPPPWEMGTTWSDGGRRMKNSNLFTGVQWSVYVTTFGSIISVVSSWQQKGQCHPPHTLQMIHSHSHNYGCILGWIMSQYGKEGHEVSCTCHQSHCGHNVSCHIIHIVFINIPVIVFSITVSVDNNLYKFQHGFPLHSVYNVYTLTVYHNPLLFFNHIRLWRR